MNERLLDPHVGQPPVAAFSYLRASVNSGKCHAWGEKKSRLEAALTSNLFQFTEKLWEAASSRDGKRSI